MQEIVRDIAVCTSVVLFVTCGMVISEGKERESSLIRMKDKVCYALYEYEDGTIPADVHTDILKICGDKYRYPRSTLDREYR